MTIAEIEGILRSLCIRHPNLDEQLLVTLLTAGGWEDKGIRDAVALYKSSPQKYKPNTEISQLPTKQPAVEQKNTTIQPDISVNSIVVPQIHSDTPFTSADLAKEDVLSTKDSADMVYYDGTGEEEKEIVMAPEIQTLQEKKDIDIPSKPLQVVSLEIDKDVHLPQEEIRTEDEKKNLQVLPVNEHVSAQGQSTVSNDPVSLITPEESKRDMIQVDPPENLPLKPFESAPHIWPFSKYKEVFHGEVMTPLPPDERALVNGMSQVTENIGIQKVESHVPKKIKIKRTGFDGEDEGLIFLTATTLLIILLLLAYMYSNGRI